MYAIGERIVAKLKSDFGAGEINILSSVPENWLQFTPAVFVLCNGYDVVGKSCSSVTIRTIWLTAVAVRSGYAQKNKVLLGDLADDIIVKVFRSLYGEYLDNRQVNPLEITDGSSVPDVLAVSSVFPVFWETKIKLEKEV